MKKKSVAAKAPKERPGRILSKAEELQFRVDLLRSELTRTQRALRVAEEELKPKMTLEDAFEYDPADSVGDVVRGTLSVSYLLHSLADRHDPVDGFILQGLAYVLDSYAEDARFYLKKKAADYVEKPEASDAGQK